MFRGAFLNTQPIPDDSPSGRRGPVVPWSWPRGARVLLGILSMVVSMVLTIVSRDVRPSDEPLPAIPDLVLDPNTAPPRALTALPHIGPALVQRLVEARNERPFASLDDLGDRIRGIGPVTLARIAPYLHIEAASLSGPTSENLATSEGVKPGRKRKASLRKPMRMAMPAPTPLPSRLAAVPELGR